MKKRKIGQDMASGKKFIYYDNLQFLLAIYQKDITTMSLKFEPSNESKEIAAGAALPTYKNIKYQLFYKKYQIFLECTNSGQLYLIEF